MSVSGSDHYSVVGGRDPSWVGVAVVLFVLSFTYALVVTELFVHTDERLLLVPLLSAVGVAAVQTYRSGGLAVNLVLGVAPLAPAAVVLPSILVVILFVGGLLGAVGFGVGAAARSLREG